MQPAPDRAWKPVTSSSRGRSSRWTASAWSASTRAGRRIGAVGAAGGRRPFDEVWAFDWIGRDTSRLRGDRPRATIPRSSSENSTPAPTLGLTTGRKLSWSDRRPDHPQSISASEMSLTSVKVDNGVNVEALLGARQALTETPEAARFFNWRATCSWVNGTHSRSTVHGFYGLGAEQSHKPNSATTPTIPKFSRPKTTARHPSSTCSSDSRPA